MQQTREIPALVTKGPKRQLGLRLSTDHVLEGLRHERNVSNTIFVAGINLDCDASSAVLRRARLRLAQSVQALPVLRDGQAGQVPNISDPDHSGAARLGRLLLKLMLVTDEGAMRKCTHTFSTGGPSSRESQTGPKPPWQNRTTFRGCHSG